MFVQEKVHDYRKSRLELGALNGSTDICSAAENLEFRRVECEGVYDEKNSILVHKYLKRKSGERINGYNLLTPLIPIPDDPRRYRHFSANFYLYSTNLDCYNIEFFAVYSHLY